MYKALGSILQSPALKKKKSRKVLQVKSMSPANSPSPARKFSIVEFSFEQRVLALE
jgi:hypothetical protein